MSGHSVLDGVDLPIFERYAGLSLPRHVSYPMPTWWRSLDAGEVPEVRALGDSERDLSLYLHLPFCEALCTFCACNKTILRREVGDGQDRVERYLAALEDELEARAADLGHGRARTVRQIHWGGGTPTYLDVDQIRRLHGRTLELFNVADDAEVSIEVDPRVTTKAQIEALAALGFNRVSMGVQDFDAKVQEHVRRVQPLGMVQDLVAACRTAGITSINFDLIYGLPYQSIESVAETVRRAIELSPDRVAFYHYAQIPDKIANQRGLDHGALPDSPTKLAMFLSGQRTFEATGYEFIGLDHFAKRDEGLAVALREGTLTRNFQGMTTGAELDLVGLGCSAISVFPGRGYLQNERVHELYAAAIEGGQDPARKGLALTEDDGRRQWLLQRLYGEARVDAGAFEARFGIEDFRAHFADELRRLEDLRVDGLVEVEPDGSFSLTAPLGRVLMRNVAAVFDAHVEPDAYKAGQPETFSASA